MSNQYEVLGKAPEQEELKKQPVEWSPPKKAI